MSFATTEQALQNLIQAIEFTPLGIRAITAIKEARAALAATQSAQDRKEN